MGFSEIMVARVSLRPLPSSRRLSRKSFSPSSSSLSSSSSSSLSSSIFFFKSMKMRGRSKWRTTTTTTSSSSSSSSTLVEEKEVIDGYTLPFPTSSLPPLPSSEFYKKEEEEEEKEDFPIPEKALFRLTEGFLATTNGVDFPEILSEDFQFIAPIIGPLDKQTFLQAFESFKLKEAFPDLTAGLYNMSVDPEEKNRVWFFTRGKGTHTGSVKLGPKIIPPSGKKVISPPQAASVTFNKNGQVEKLTAGYILDKNIGNTGGLGGVFGLLWAIGVPFPFPEGLPSSRSWQFRLFTSQNKFLQAIPILYSLVINFRNKVAKMMLKLVYNP